MTTYSLPFFETGETNDKEKVIGIVTADVSVEWLTKELSWSRFIRPDTVLVSDTGIFCPSRPEPDNA